MRKEVKRTLLLWPAAASATITAVSWMGTQLPSLSDTSSMIASIERPVALALNSLSFDSGQPTTSSRFRRSTEPVPGAEWTVPVPNSFSHDRHGSIGSRHSQRDLSSTNLAALARLAPATSKAATSGAVTNATTTAYSRPVDWSNGVFELASTHPVTDRDEHGSRGVRLPQRVAEAFGQDNPTPLLAPVRSEQFELAGLALQLHQDQSAAQDLADGTCIIADVPLNHRTLQSLRNRSRVLQVVPRRDLDASDDLVIDQETIALISPAQARAQQDSGSNVAKNDDSDPNVFELKPARRPSSLPESNRALAKPVRVEQPVLETVTNGDTESFVTDLPQIRLNLPSHTVSKRSASDWPAGWPVTTQLDAQLAALANQANDPAIHQWSEDVASKLATLRSLPRLGDQRAGDLIGDLGKLAIEGEAAAEALEDRESQVDWLRAVHGLTRRVQVWQPVWAVTRDSQPTWMVTDQIDGSASLLVVIDEVVAAIEAVRADLHETGDVEGWASYLLLDEIEKAATATHRDVAKREERSIVAQRLLSRLSWHALQEGHLQWLDRDSVNQLANTVRPWARGAVDYADLLAQIERQETDAIDLAAIDIADAVQTLRFAENDSAVAIAKSLGAYYRNANVRMAISEDMLNRMLPSIDPQNVPVNTTMMGNRIRGVSQINSDLAISLTPSPDRWMLRLSTLGHVSTRSTGFSGPVAVDTTGSSRFVAATPIVVSRNGIATGDVNVDVDGRMKLRGIRSDYDRWPLVGSLVRSIAESRYDEMAPISNRMASSKIKQEVASEMQGRLDEQVSSATDQLSNLVLGPLGKLKLDPQVIDMQTTNDRLLARYRLAGDWQLAAFTPRPRAPKSSLMSLQVHQSAINNTLEQLVPRDQPMPIEDVIAHGAGMFGKEFSMPEDMPEGVTIQFARTRPITVEIEDGKLWVTMRIVRLSQGTRVDLTQFIVRAAYIPQVDGLDASLVRDGHLRISGPGMSMRERLPVRAIFNKVLAASRPLPLTLPVLTQHPAMKGLAVSQLELRGGWVAIALSEENAPRVAWLKN
ncbi:hypothetical protein K227x_38640 [Rubripirellula lacrimiformis]|uniref:Uncharacterized protein n=1 Tax=Rubripirellula lacrimiformis TaxID=1930273 RepID=A0A517NEA9_9BACT|nr:hypothetical protein [Rubripirellula lacrimiformis]QDT05464.1 hypothetical protein K227x_38640 [Rubripirellula lacrimiformis]